MNLSETAFRLDPIMDPRGYQTYQILAPVQTHTRPASCEEVDCEYWRNGWITRVDTSTPLGARQANYIRLHSGRRFTTGFGLDGEEDTHDDVFALVMFHFPPGQQCFTQHRVPLDRPATFLRVGGDHRGNPTGERVKHSSAEDWRDDLGEHLDKIRDQRERG